jgi:hypothetical protein
MSQPEQWQLSGNAAEMYERYVVPYLLGPWAPGLAALQPGERVLAVARVLPPPPGAPIT